MLQQVDFKAAVVITLRWPDFLSTVNAKVLSIQYIETDNSYVVFALDAKIVYTSTLIKLDASGSFPFDNYSPDYDQTQNDTDVAEFEASYKTTGNRTVALHNTDSVPLFTPEPRLGTEVVYGTHNFSDPTTWAGDSVRVVDEVATDSGDGLIWNLAHPRVIDMVHGKVFDEDQYVRDQQEDNPGDPHGYSVIVKTDSVEQTMRAPFATEGGDYEVNYAEGKIIFFESQAGSTVEVSYSYENGSTFYIIPDAGTTLDIEAAKAMWSNDFEMNDSVRFEVWALAAAVAPHLGLPEGTKIPVATTEYRTLTQLTSEASEYTPFAVPATGGAQRGASSPRHAVHFRYGTIRRLASLAGIELRVRTGSHQPMGGEFTTATFYCVVRSQS